MEYSPFSRLETDVLKDRLQAGERLSYNEVKRIEFLTPVMNGEFLISAYRGQVFVKRYHGIDVTEI
jgi:hypothetical protein